MTLFEVNLTYSMKFINKRVKGIVRRLFGQKLVDKVKGLVGNNLF